MAFLLHLPRLPGSTERPFFKPSSSHPVPSLQRMVFPHPMTCHSYSAPYKTSSPPLRRTANFRPTIWDDSYIQSLPTGFMEKYVDCREKLKEEVKSLIGKQRGLNDQLEFVDTLRQLGVAYHFDSEIKDFLISISSSVENNNNLIKNSSLHATTLMFRVLREHGINILSVNVLMSCYRNERDSIDCRNEHSVKGMLSLYEASYLAVEGEDELEEAGEFATKYLRSLNKSLLDQQFIEEIDHALDLPLHWRMPRLHARWFIDVYGRQENKNLKLFEFAKLDFNEVQSVYKKELKEMSRWWGNTGIVCDELSFARDRLMEHYLWSTGFIFRPEFSRCRKAMTKINCFITLIDDIYDIYGTMDELELFTDAVLGWKISEDFPEYMKICLTSLIKTMDDIANNFSADKGFNILPCLKQLWGDLCKAYLVEARWYHTGYTPTLDEYLENAWVSISGHCALTTSYCLSDELTLEALNKFNFYPSIVRTSSMLLRLYDDLGTSMDEIQRGDVSKSIQCYMNEKNTSELEAREYIKHLIKKYWKELNEKCVSATKYIKPYQESLMDIPRMAQCFYQYGDGHGKPNKETRDRVILLLIEPIAL